MTVRCLSVLLHLLHNYSQFPVSWLVFCVCRSVIAFLVVSTSVIDCLERLVSETTCYELSGILSEPIQLSWQGEDDTSYISYIGFICAVTHMYLDESICLSLMSENIVHNAYRTNYKIKCILFAAARNLRNTQPQLFMVALCNRADHYIFILFLSSSSFFFFFLA